MGQMETAHLLTGSVEETVSRDPIFLIKVFNFGIIMKNPQKSTYQQVLGK